MGSGVSTTRLPPSHRAGAYWNDEGACDVGRGSALCAVEFLQTPAFGAGSEIDRAIRTARLNGLPHVHLRPINVMVSHGPQGDLVLRLVSRLDAFSGYPFRT